MLDEICMTQCIAQCGALQLRSRKNLFYSGYWRVLHRDSRESLKTKQRVENAGVVTVARNVTGAIRSVDLHFFNAVGLA
jgi:hypothetical protein